MREYVVDCEQVPYGEGKVLVLPVSVNGHVHEQLIRCRDCRFCGTLVFQADERHECRLSPYARHFTEPDGYCHKGKPRGGDG